MKRWRIVVLAVVVVLAITLVVFKEVRGSVTDDAGPVTLTLEDRISVVAESAEPFVLVFHAEPASFCCEDTRLYYEDMRESSRYLVDVLEGVCPCLFIEVNSLSGVDREVFISIVKRYSIQDMNSAVVVGTEGSKVTEFHAPFYPSTILAYMQKQL